MRLVKAANAPPHPMENFTVLSTGSQIWKLHRLPFLFIIAKLLTYFCLTFAAQFASYLAKNTGTELLKLNLQTKNYC